MGEMMRVALTGTPGTGKSSVARRLSREFGAVEVGDLARRIGTARGTRARRTVEVDLRRTTAWLERHPASGRQVLVGHLAHLLPVDLAIVLRCHPLELGRRLRRARRGNPRTRADNVAAEATDVVLVEARARIRRVREVDTTGRTPDAVAREVVRILRGRASPRGPRVRWLEDPEVTAALLDRRP